MPDLIGEVPAQQIDSIPFHRPAPALAVKRAAEGLAVHWLIGLGFEDLDKAEHSPGFVLQYRRPMSLRPFRKGDKIQKSEASSQIPPSLTGTLFRGSST